MITLEVELLLSLVLKILEDNKAEDVITISLKGKSNEADHMVVASGSSNRSVSALSEKLIQGLKNDLGIYVRTEGLNNADWVLLDSGDVIIHVFRQEVREFYQIEKMWQTNTVTKIASENL